MKKALPLIAVFLLFAMGHPFYLGVCDLKYSEKEKALQGSLKLFINDLEDALKKMNGKPTDLINIKDSVATGKILEDYVRKRLQLNVNGKVLKYKFLGFEKEEEALWLYIEAPGCPRPKKLDVSCSLLYDYLKQQMNIFHVEVGAEKKSLKIQNPEKSVSFWF